MSFLKPSLRLLVILVLFPLTTRAQLGQADGLEVLPAELHKAPCCYGDEEFKHGDVILSLPLNCVQLVCRYGRIRTVYYDQPGQCHCCELNGTMYRPGERIPDICIDMTCREGQWVSQGYIDECCRECFVRDDPHFVSFDDVAFDFHGKCNYSITQEFYGYNSPYGVYSDFRPCMGRSCLDITTFKDNTHTVVTMTYPQTTLIRVNDDLYTVTPTIQPLESSGIFGTNYHPVLAWQHGNCIRFLGTQGLVMDYCWFGWVGEWSKIYIWAYPSLANKLNGLCGHFNYIRNDDLTHRNGFTVTPPPALPTGQPNGFGNSWKTLVQDPANPQCPVLSIGRNKRQAENSTVVDEVDCPPEMFDAFFLECLELLGSVNHEGHTPSQETLEIHAAFCASDLCAFAQDNAAPDDTRSFKQAMQGMLATTIKNDVMTTPGARPPPNDGGGDDGGDDGRDDGGYDGGDDGRDDGGDGMVRGDGPNGNIKVKMSQNMEVEVPQ